VWAQKHSRISPSCFLAKCRMIRLNKVVLFCCFFVLFAFSELYLVCVLSVIFNLSSVCVFSSVNHRQWHCIAYLCWFSVENLLIHSLHHVGLDGAFTCESASPQSFLTVSKKSFSWAKNKWCSIMWVCAVIGYCWHQRNITILWCTILIKSALSNIQGGPKKLSHILLSISLPNIDRFSKFFHLHIWWKICNKLVIAYTTTP